MPSESITLFNLSVPNDISTGLVNRLEFETKFRVTTYPCDEIEFIISIGTNDSGQFRINNEPITSIGSFKSNLKLITEISSTFSKKIVFVGLPPCEEQQALNATVKQDWPSYFNNKRILEYNDVIEEHCHEYGLMFVDVHSIFLKNNSTPLLSEDGLHPNSMGYDFIANIVMNSMNIS